MVIVLGMNLNAFEAARQADFHHAVIMGPHRYCLGGGGPVFFFLSFKDYYLVDRTLEKTRDYTREVEERAPAGRKARCRRKAGRRCGP